MRLLLSLDILKLVNDGFCGISAAMKYLLSNPPQETSGPRSFSASILADLGTVDVLGDIGDGAVMTVTVHGRGRIDVLIPGEAAVLIQGNACEIIDPDLQSEAEFVRAGR